MPSTQVFDAARGTYFNFDPAKLVVIGLDTGDGPDHPLHDERVREPEDGEALQALAKNIALHGVIEPVVIRKDGTTAQVVAGRRRVSAARIANAMLAAEGKEPITVPCVVRKQDERDLLGVMVSENEIREDDAFLVRARKVARMQAFGISVERIALCFGVKVPAVRRWARVLDLDGSILAAIRDGRIAPSAAMELCDLPRERQVEAFEAIMVEIDVRRRPSTVGRRPDEDRERCVSVDGPAVEPTVEPTVEPAAESSAEPASERKVKRPTRQQVRSALDGQGAVSKPKKRPVELLRKVAATAVSESAPKLHPQALAILRWVIGEADGLDVENLSAVVALAELPTEAEAGSQAAS